VVYTPHKIAVSDGTLFLSFYADDSALTAPHCAYRDGFITHLLMSDVGLVWRAGAKQISGLMDQIGTT
jgi:hypothetical protein